MRPLCSGAMMWIMLAGTGRLSAGGWSMRWLLAGLMMVGLLNGCTQAPVGQGGFGHVASLYAVRDAYAIAHGMAFSYAGSDDAEPAVVAQLVRLDARALEAVRSMERSPQGAAQARETADAVAALTEFAARQTSTPQ